MYHAEQYATEHGAVRLNGSKSPKEVYEACMPLSSPHVVGVIHYRVDEVWWYHVGVVQYVSDEEVTDG